MRPVSLGRAEALQEALTGPILTRGPDGRGNMATADGKVGLVHTRLAIIDPSARSDQPMAAAEAGLSITFNGEIYNYAELRRELAQAGVALRTEGDTEVVLQGYAAHGSAFLTRLRGMYAVVLHDARRGQVVALRDPFGIKPLYVARSPNEVIISSSPKAAADASGHACHDPAAAVSTAVMGCVLEPLSLWRGVEALEPGVLHVWDVNTLAAPERIPVQPAFPWHEGSPGQGDAELEAALEDTILAHFTADVPVALFQSAGLDSTAFATVASRLGLKPTLLTIGFEEFRGTPFDEIPGAAAVGAGLGLEHRIWRVEREEFLALSKTYFDAMESPTVDGVNSFLASELARREGFKVALSGVGGDELFGGYPSFVQLPRLARLAGVLRRAHAVGILDLAARAAALDRRRSPKLRYLARYLAPFPRSYLLRRCYFAVEELGSVLDPDVMAEGLPRFWAAFEKQAAACVGEDETAVGMLERDVYMRNMLLKDADWTGMARGVEIRVPFVDIPFFRRVCDPGGRARYRKGDLRTLIGRLGPQLDTTVRPKTGFLIPHHQWMGESGARPDDLKRFGSAGPRLWTRHVLSHKFPGWTSAA